MRAIWGEPKQWKFDDCGAAAIQHWLYVQETLWGDLKHLNHKVIFHYERFALGRSQGCIM